jgi:hypothetical protein
MSATEFKVGDKVRVRDGLINGFIYDGITVDDDILELSGKILTIWTVGRYNYQVHENGWLWNDKMLEPVEKTLNNLCAGDFIRSGGGIRKILVAVDGCYLLSRIEEYTSTDVWCTVNELEEAGYSFIEPDALEPTVEIDGKKYKKADVEEAIKDLEVVD